MAKRVEGADQKLLRAISAAIKRTKCSPRDCVNVLLSSAAGVAAASSTYRCHDFGELAHSIFHNAREVVEDSVIYVQAGSGGFEN